MNVYDPELLDSLESLPTIDWSGSVWRHMFNDYMPDRVNTSGARWNPPEVGAIYTALERDTAIAEGQHAIDMQSRPFHTRRVVYEVNVLVSDLIDLTRPAALDAVGLRVEDVQSDDFVLCQKVGGAAAWLERGGLIVPSARAASGNLVILVGAASTYDDMRIISTEVIEQAQRHQ